MSNKVYGYCRVSTKEQNLERQIGALKDYGIDERDIITDKVSGKNFNREGYTTLKNQLLRKGDTLVIKELDRLGRNAELMKEEWNELIKMGVDIVVLEMPILNTTNKGSVEKTLISNIVFELLSYMAEKERIKNKSRQSEAYEKMPINEKGKRYSAKTKREMGRPTATYPANWNEVYTEWKANKISGVKAMELMDLKKTTFYKLVKQHEGNK